MAFACSRALDEIDAGDEANLLAVIFDGLDAQGCGHVAFAGARTANQHDIVGAIYEILLMELAGASLISLAAKSKPARAVSGRIESAGTHKRLEV